MIWVDFQCSTCEFSPVIVESFNVLDLVEANMANKNADRNFQVFPPTPKYLVFLKDVEFYRKHMQCRSSCLGVMTSGGTAANIQAEIFGRSFV